MQVDLVILNERASSYVQDLQNALDTMVRISQSRSRPRTSGGSIFVLRGDLISPEARDALSVAARAILIGRRGPLADQLDRLDLERRPAVPPRAPAEPAIGLKNTWSPQLEFWNGLGGFDQNGREYVTILRDGATDARALDQRRRQSGLRLPGRRRGRRLHLVDQQPREPDHAMVERSGVNRTGEAIYIRDEDSRVLWGPMASPIRNRSSTYIARHGRGYSRFEHTANGVALDLVQFVPLEDPVKISRLTIRNVSGRRRRLSVTAYVEWVLAPLREAAVPFIVTEIELATAAPFSPATSGAASSARGRPSSISADGSSRGPGIAASSSAATARSPRPRHWLGAPLFPAGSAPASTRARRSAPRSCSSRTNRPRSSFSSARPPRRRRRKR